MSSIDSNGDGWSDARELTATTDPYDKDSDGDGYWDSKDANPLDPDINTVDSTSPSEPTYPEPEKTPETIPASSPEPETLHPPVPSDELSLPEIELPEIIDEESISTELIARDYTWTYEGEWSWHGEIPQFLYEYYQKLPRPPTMNYSVYVTHPLDDPYIDILVDKIEEAARKRGFNDYQTVEFAAAFVQSLPYTADSVTTPFDEYPRYPVETLVDNGGDCEDTSILLASIIEKLGYGVVLIELPDHCAVGVKGGENVYGAYWEHEGNKYFYIETTDLGWKIGEIPDVYEGATATTYPMVPVPILTHEGSLKGNDYFAEVEVTVKNIGTAPAQNVSVLAGFDAGEDLVWNSQESQFVTIGVNQEAKVTLKLRIPSDKHTRLIVQVLNDNIVVNESYSEWFDT
jgi:hypothetical protein